MDLGVVAVLELELELDQVWDRGDHFRPTSQKLHE